MARRTLAARSGLSIEIQLVGLAISAPRPFEGAHDVGGLYPEALQAQECSSHRDPRRSARLTRAAHVTGKRGRLDGARAPDLIEACLKSFDERDDLRPR